jgi:hypothetical protein
MGQAMADTTTSTSKSKTTANAKQQATTDAQTAQDAITAQEQQAITDQLSRQSALGTSSQLGTAAETGTSAQQTAQRGVTGQQTAGVTASEVPEWMKAAGINAFTNYHDLANQAIYQAGGGLTPEQIAAGQTYVAPTSDLSRQGVSDVSLNAFNGMEDLNNAAGVLDPSNFDRELNLGQGLSRGVDANGNPVVNYEDFNAQNLQRYTNPYQQMVIDRGLSDIDRANALDQKNLNDAAVKASAFGGARHGIAQGELLRNTEDKRNAFLTENLNTGYNNAISQRNAERNAAVQGLSLEDQQRLQGANALTDVAGKKQQMGLTGANAEIGAGNISQAQQQRQLDEAAKARQEGITAPLTFTQGELNALNAVPVDKITTNAGTMAGTSDITGSQLGQTASTGTTSQLGTTTADTTGEVIGAADTSSQGLASTTGSAQTDSQGTSSSKTKTKGSETTPVASTDLTGQLIGAGATILGGLAGGPAGATLAGSLTGALMPPATPSSEELKTDIKEPEGSALNAFSKVPVKSYKYKKGVANAFGLPTDKRTGPMAQDWKNAFGGDGQTIDIGKHLGALTQAVKELDARTRRVAR